MDLYLWFLEAGPLVRFAIVVAIPSLIIVAAALVWWSRPRR